MDAEAIIVEASETGLVLRVPDGACVVEYKEFPEDWADARSVFVADGTQAELEGLNPTSTYCVRLYRAENGERVGEPGPEAEFDTKVAGCGPKKKKRGSCVVQ